MKLEFKVRLMVLATCLWGIMLTAKAQTIFGNSSAGENYGFSIAIENGNTGGAAISFTPMNDITVSSVTVWLADYTGAGNLPYDTATYSINAGIYENTTFGPPPNFNEPGKNEVAALNMATPNDGSLAPFTLNLPEPVVLDANQQYWFFMFMQGGYLGTTSYWVGGDGTPTGEAIYDGSEDFSNGGFSSSSFTPAFTINSVPEPATPALAALGVAGLLAFRRRK